jgi:hypothetical protein
MLNDRREWPSPTVLATALLAYTFVTLACSWPLPLHLGDSALGPVDSDLGVYVWNLWVFRHEAAAGHFPLFTSAIFSLGAPTDLSLHNYTLFADALAAPLLPTLGVVTSYNLLCLANLALGAFAMFLLVWHVTRQAPAAWLAGLLFGFSPTLMTRATVHPSLSAAAPLPLFVLVLLRLDATRSRWWAVAAGATLAWAAICDPYYAIYCLVLSTWYLAAKALRVKWGPVRWRSGGFGQRVLDGVIACLLPVVATIALTGGFRFQIGIHAVGMTTLYTPVLILTVALALRIARAVHLRIAVVRPLEWVGLVRLVPYGVAAGGILLSPLLYALVARLFDGRYVASPVLWRTSMPGVDLASLLIPNPNSVWLGTAWREWVTNGPGGFAENVASIPIVSMVIILLAWRFARFRVPGLWAGLALLAGSLVLGPFVRIAGTTTYVPTPWTFLRYLPLIGGARAPARFAVLVILAVAVVFGLALKSLLGRYQSRRWPILGAAAALLVLELCPAPRVLFDASMPEIYATISADPRDVRVLELPFGVRDGLSSFGDFSASSQFYQTRHGKRLIGGYLSRVSRNHLELVRRRPVLAALMALSEGREVSAGELESAKGRGRTFIQAANVGYVVIDRQRAGPRLIDFAREAMDLERIGAAGGRELYRPRNRETQLTTAGVPAATAAGQSTAQLAAR